ncbi:IclR family transcriptional regulator C-terminal domain-containing protein [Devosia sp. YIM 151766]|uniref:IclR family transcriptional regulator domain-containing protein n=1 Tax=Devosia sp. YIM 151766 TaxID=3017325 RepID=UPI00255D064D|nr:IclR family transcriptional regulator C-terminal domain-containing protein [Devosia sp. YIM 151766]WIY52591.1 IclR family transcriptional regulator C-terminal domain-containing protein [Devosia sp. YIM 151766]
MTRRHDNAVGWEEEDAPQISVKGAALIGKATEVLTRIGSAPGKVGFAELSSATGIARATLYRILSALASRGLIRIDPVTQNYTLGFQFLELAQNVWSSADLASVASAELRRLRDMTGETAYLAVQEKRHVLALGRFEGAHSRRSNARLGALKPMHCTSQGKAILSALSEAQVDAILHEGMERFTPFTIVDPAALKVQLQIIRARGYATDDEEIVEGTRCVGAAVTDRAGRPIAAISVAGPVYRMTVERAEQLGREIAEAARRISDQLAPYLFETRARHPDIRQASEAAGFATGSPFWDASRGHLCWVDKLAPSVHGLRGPKDVFSLDVLGESLVSAAQHEDGVVIASVNRIGLLARDGQFDLRDLAGDKRLTTILALPDGALWAAATRRDVDGAVLGPLDLASGKIDPVFELPDAVSGLAVNRDGTTLYATLPGRGAIYQLAPLEKRKRIFADLPKVAGSPAALALDGEERVWVAMADGWSIIRLNEDGDFDRTIAIPVPAPTGICFGGANYDRLFVTSARLGLTREALMHSPLSGHVLELDAGQPGSPASVTTLSPNQVT